MNRQQFDEAMTNGRYIADCPNHWDTTVPRAFFLSSTPLNEAILAATEIIPAFREKNNLQVVNSVFLTDGYSNSNSIGRDDIVRLKGQRIGQKLEVSSSTHRLITLMQSATNTKAVGMFVGSRFGQVSSHFSHEKYSAAEKSFKKENFVISERKGGYAEHFCVRADTKVDNTSLLDNLKVGASNTQIKSAFLKGAKKKNISRVMLNRFIDIIA
jgi:hypothetical protein